MKDFHILDLFTKYKDQGYSMAICNSSDEVVKPKHMYVTYFNNSNAQRRAFVKHEFMLEAELHL